MVILERYKKCGKLIDLYELTQLGKECKFALAGKNEAPVKRSVRLTNSGAGPWDYSNITFFFRCMPWACALATL